MQGDSEDILDRFTDPVKKQRKKRKRQEKHEEQCKKVRMSGKEFAADWFDGPLTEDQLKILQQNVVLTKLPKEADLETWLETVTEDLIGYKKDKKGVTCMAAVFEFILCSAHCQKWLQREFEKMGFKQNMTNYNPVAVSHCVAEVLGATVECYKMGCKQMLRYLETLSK